MSVYLYQKCNEFCSQANLLLDKFKKDKISAEEAWIHLEKCKFNVTEALKDIERNCQVF